MNSLAQGKPIVYVAVNYRLGGWGFLNGGHIQRYGVANLGLQDQRLGLQWTADNIAAFGGDPSRVTIWGESAGSISVFDQMLLYGGNNKYKGKALFRGAIMNSGSVVPAAPVNGTKGQAVFKAITDYTGCTNVFDKLGCLRKVPYAKYLAAVNSLPGIFSHDSVALSYLPRPDGVVLPYSPDIALQLGKYAAVPMLIGDQNDEGTLFSLVQTDISTTAQLVAYLKNVFFFNANLAQLTALVNSYPDDASAGSPFGTGPLYNIYPQFKRLAAMLGDLTFTLSRRLMLNAANQVYPNVPSWTFLNTYDTGVPVAGTFHSSDLNVNYGKVPGIPQMLTQNYYYSFIYNLDPNTPGQTTWPQWSSNKAMMEFTQTGASVITDDFRSAQYASLVATAPFLQI